MPKQGQYVPAMFLNHCVGGALCGLLWLYQACVSPFMGAQCRHLPTCSEFAKDALGVHGPLRGSWYVLKRILRCHPWATPVFDPVPPICSGDDQSNADGRTPADGHSSDCCRAPMKRSL